MTYRIIQWCTGFTGRHSLQQVIDHPDLELVGVYVTNPDKDGVDAGTLIGRPEVGVRATTDKAAILALSADCVLYNALRDPAQTPNDDDVLALLDSGKNVVSNVAGYRWPASQGPERGLRFEKACAEGGVTLYGAGLEPGFMDRLSVVLTTLCASVKEIRLTIFYNPSGAPRPVQIMKTMGMGSSPDEFKVDSPRGDWYFNTLTEAAYATAFLLGTEVKKIDREVRVGAATRDFDIAAGHIAKGTVAAIAWSLIAHMADGTTVRTISQRIVQSDLPGWEDPPPCWRLEIEGEPSIRAEVRLASSVLEDGASVALSDANPLLLPEPQIQATAYSNIRAIPEVVAAPPGVMQPHFTGTWSSRLRSPALPE